jgi:hypothetical protein
VVYNGKPYVRIENGKRSINIGLDEAVDLHAELGRVLDRYRPSRRPSLKIVENFERRR